MDAVGLSILERELAADRAVLLDASSKARQRLVERAAGFAEACAYRSFSNAGAGLPRDRSGRKAPPTVQAAPLRELKGFRHVTRHAYDLKLRAARLEELTAMAENVSSEFGAWCDDFVAQVRKEQGW